MPRRSGAAYRCGFNGQEEGPEFWGGAVSSKYRVEDARVGRFFSVDPLAATYPWNSSYAFAENDVIRAMDLEGAEKLIMSATIVETVGETKINSETADFIIYILGFYIENPDGSTSPAVAPNNLVMFESKSQQEGRKASNALHEGIRYNLGWGLMGNKFQGKEVVYIGKAGLRHSDLTRIHPLTTTAASTGGDYRFTTGCKGIGFSEGMSTSPDGRDLFTDKNPFTYTHNSKSNKPTFSESKKYKK